MPRDKPPYNTLSWKYEKYNTKKINTKSYKEESVLQLTWLGHYTEKSLGKQDVNSQPRLQATDGHRLEVAQSLLTIRLREDFLNKHAEKMMPLS